jgi:hypothetical protein
MLKDTEVKSCARKDRREFGDAKAREAEEAVRNEEMRTVYKITDQKYVVQ